MSRKPKVILTQERAGSQPQLIVRQGNSFAYILTICILLAVIGYVFFTTFSMVPQARAHFIELLFNPKIELFLSR